MSLKEGKQLPALPQRPRRTVAVADLSPSAVDAWPSSAAFDLISAALGNEAERKDAVKKGGAIFAFTLKNDKNETASWYIDLKETGTVGKGEAPAGKKAGVTLVTSDVAFAQLISGKANAQKLWMSGKLKVKGGVMKALRIEPVLKRAQMKAKL
ncbi:hypothetical protein LTR08_001956 [Meristemomyces frigidus]|nr:hypothetical protein LTR08_001956 [Meristemomyces frigidus]